MLFVCENTSLPQQTFNVSADDKIMPLKRQCRGSKVHFIYDHPELLHPRVLYQSKALLHARLTVIISELIILTTEGQWPDNVI